MGADNGTGIGTDKLLQIIIVDAAFSVGIGKVKPDTVFRLQVIKRAEDGIVLKAGGNNMLTVFDRPAYRDIQSFRGVACKNHPGWIRTAETGSQCGSCPVYHPV